MATAEGVMARADDRAASAVEISVVMPCLNEAETLAVCIGKAQQALREQGIAGEVIVADNGSTDGSQQIAAGLGARVVAVEKKGYSDALRGGIAAARGRYVLMGDADDSYDFSHLPRFVAQLRQGYDLVVGNRFRGGIAPGAMRPLHRYVGVPIMSRIAQVLFRSPCGDHHCGLRAFSQDAFERLDLRASGWEFNSEMIARASLMKMRITEVPTTLAPDGRGRPPHLRTFDAGWQHLRMMLLYSPRWIFFYPGVLMMLAGAAAVGWLAAGPRTVFGVTFNIVSLLYAAAAVLLGFQAVSFGVLGKIAAIRQGIHPEDPRFARLLSGSTLEFGLVAGTVLMLAGLAGALWPFFSWSMQQFHLAHPQEALRTSIPALIALALGFQVVLSSFFVSLLGMRR